MKRMLVAIFVCVFCLMPAACSFAQTSMDSNLSSEISSEGSENQGEVEQVDSEMSVGESGA